MKKTILMVLNPVIFLLLLYQAFTGYFRESFHELFHSTHAVTGGLLLILGLVHLTLNWPWVRSSFFRRKRTVTG